MAESTDQEDGSTGAKITAQGFQFLLRPLRAQVNDCMSVTSFCAYSKVVESLDRCSQAQMCDCSDWQSYFFARAWKASDLLIALHGHRCAVVYVQSLLGANMEAILPLLDPTLHAGLANTRCAGLIASALFMPSLLLSVPFSSARIDY